MKRWGWVIWLFLNFALTLHYANKVGGKPLMSLVGSCLGTVCVMATIVIVEVRDAR